MSTLEAVVILVGLGVAGVGGLALLDVVIRRADVAAGLLLGIMVLEISLPEVRLGLDAGGVRVFVEDGIQAIVTAAAVARFLRLRRTTVTQRLLLLLLALSVLSLLVGVAALGIQAPVNDFRTFLGFFGVGLYFATFTGPEETLERIGRLVLWSAAVLGGVVCLRWIGSVIGVQPGPLFVEYGTAIRVMTGPQSFYLGCVLFLVLPRVLDGVASAQEQWMALWLFVLTVLLNRRTVWLAVIVGIAILLYRRKGLGGRARPILAMVAVIGVTLFLAFPDTAGSSDSEVALSPTDTGNLEWRVDGWRSLIVDNGPTSATEWLIGLPMGAGYEREVVSGRGTDRTVESRPHSFHIQTMLRTGVLGLGVFVILLALLLRRQAVGARLAPEPEQRTPLLTSEVLLVIVVMQIVWFGAWQVGNDAGLFFGLAAATWWSHLQRPVGDDSASPAATASPRSRAVVSGGSS